MLGGLWTKGPENLIAVYLEQDYDSLLLLLDDDIKVGIYTFGIVSFDEG